MIESSLTKNPHSIRKSIGTFLEIKGIEIIQLNLLTRKFNRMKKLLRLIPVVMLLSVFSSCGPSRVVVTDRPNPPVEVRPAAPYPNYVWIDGEWIANGGSYTWRSGYWAAPRAGHVWVGGSWAARGNGWYWVRGHWN